MMETELRVKFEHVRKPDMVMLLIFPTFLFGHTPLAQLAAGQDIDISDLSDGEERAFCAAVGRGEVTLPVEPWTPWWTLPDASELKLAADGCARVREIVEVGEEEDAAHKSDADLASTSQLPAPPDAPLPPLRLLTAAPPALSVAWSAMQTLAAYAWVLRSFNGNPESDWEGAAGLFLESAPSLQPAAPSGRPQPACSTLDEALAPLDAASAPGPSPARDAADLVALGRSIVVLALVDAARLLQRGSGTSEAPAESRLERDARRQRRRALQAAQRKLVFLLSWANERREEEYALWAALLRERAGSEPDAGIRLTEGRG